MSTTTNAPCSARNSPARPRNAGTALAEQARALIASGATWREIAKTLTPGLGHATLYRFVAQGHEPRNIGARMALGLPATCPTCGRAKRNPATRKPKAEQRPQVFTQLAGRWVGTDQI